MESCSLLAVVPLLLKFSNMYLQSATQAEDTVVGGLGLQALQGGLDDVVLLGEQIISPTRQCTSAHQFTRSQLRSSFFRCSFAAH